MNTLLIARVPSDPPRYPRQHLSSWDVCPKVLIVDPSLAIGQVLALWLQAHGFAVRYVDGLDAALAACSADPPHLLIAYRSIRGGTPQQLYSLLRADPALRHLAMLYITSLDDPRDVQAALAAGANAYHRIPFDIDQLYEQVRLLLAHTQGWLLPPSAHDFRPRPT